MPGPTTERIQRFDNNIDLYDDIINGGINEIVTVGSGPVRTVANAVNAISTFNPRGSWATSTAYAVKDLVVDSGNVLGYGSGTILVVAMDHTSGDLATDFAAGRLGLHQTVDQRPRVSQYAGLTAALGAIGANVETLVIDEPTAGNDTIPSNITLLFEGNGVLTGDPVINGPVIAPSRKIFDGAPTGFGSVSDLRFEWWGAEGDGITDDTAAAQAALAVLKQDAVIDLSGRSYAVSGLLVAQNDVTVSNGRFIALPSASEAVIKAAQGTSGVSFNSLSIYIDKTQIAAPDLAGIFFDRCMNGRAINCHVDGSKNDNYVPHMYSSIYGYQASQIEVRGCSVINADKEGIMFRLSDDVYIYDCVGRDSGYSNIGTSGGSRAIIKGCRAFNSGATNITMNSEDSIVSNCLAVGNVTNNGILIGHSHEAQQHAKNCLVSNNRVLSSGGNGVAVVYGVNVSIEGNVVTSSTGDGIRTIPHPTERGGVSVSNNSISGANVGVYSYGESSNQLTVTGNSIYSTSSSAILLASNGQIVISGNVVEDCGSGFQVLGHVSGSTLSGDGVTNLVVDGNVVKNSDFWALNIRHIKRVLVTSNIFDTINTAASAFAPILRLEGTNGGTASNMPTSVLFGSNKTTNTNAASSVILADANTKDAVVTKFSLQGNDLQDFTASRVYSGAGFGSTSEIRLTGNQVGTDLRTVPVTLASGTTQTVISNSNLVGQDSGPLLVAEDADFASAGAFVSSRSFGSITLSHSAPSGDAQGIMVIQ